MGNDLEIPESRTIIIPCDVCWFCVDNGGKAGRYGGKLIFDKILIDDEVRLKSSNDDDESVIFGADETGLFCADK